MTFELEQQELLSHGLKRIADEQLAAAQDLLAQPITDPEHSVHESRKCLIRVRSVLRLVRGEIGGELYRPQNHALRDIARELAASRDTAAASTAFENIHEHLPESVPPESIELIRTELEAKDAKGTTEFLQRDGHIEVLRELLGTARESVHAWPIDRNDFRAIKEGLGRIYKAGRRAFGEVAGEASDDNLHEWRKQVKYLWRALRVLRTAAPDEFSTPVHQLRSLSKLLGDDHDLLLLREAVATIPQLPSDHLAEVLATITKHRADLQESAKERGSRFFSPKPRTFVRQIREYWLLRAEPAVQAS